jgi:heat shock protein HslJ
MRRRAVLAGGALLAAASARAQPGIEGRDWRVTTVGGQPVPAGSDASLRLEGGRGFGSTGCNRFTGGATLEGQTLRFGLLATTRRACPPPFDELEQRVTAALGSIAAWRLDGATLLLLDAAGAERLRLVPG